MYLSNGTLISDGGENKVIGGRQRGRAFLCLKTGMELVKRLV